MKWTLLFVLLFVASDEATAGWVEPTIGGGSTPTARYGHCAFLNGSDVIVFGGTIPFYNNFDDWAWKLVTQATSTVTDPSNAMASIDGHTCTHAGVWCRT